MNFNKKLAVAVSGAVLLMAGQFALADSTTDIVDALVSKGVLTEEEGKLISKGHETKKKAEGNIGFKNGFKINSGDGKSNFSVNGRIQSDFRSFNGPDGFGGSTGNLETANTFSIRRAYLTAKGTFRNWINYEATLDGAGSHILKYYWLETAFSEKFKVRFGQYKMPGSLEQQTSSRFIDFTERDWVTSLAPAVNKGIMIHGVPTPGLTYAASVSNGGVLADTGSGIVQETGSGSDGKAYNVRVTANIAEFMGNKEAIAHVGGWYGRDSSLPSLTTGVLKFSTNAKGTTFFSHTSGLAYQNPDINRGGLEGIASYGPVKLQAEWANLELEQENIPSRDVTAWYAGASWMITGEKYAESYKNGVMDRMSPKNDFTGLGSSGMGAWELGIRYSKFDAKDFVLGTHTTVSTSSNDVDSISAGVKWIVDPNTRFLADYIYTDFNASILGNSASNRGVSYSNEKAVNFRAQFDF